MRILLFDWTLGGHHLLYVRRMAEALRERCDVVLAVPDEALSDVSDLQVETRSLGGARPSLNPLEPLPAQHRALADRELDLLSEAAGASRVDHLVHLYADPVLRRLVRRPPLPAPTTLCVFFPRAHYPRLFGTPLSPKETLRAWFLEALVARWRARRDAHAVLTIDPEAARRWSAQAGAPAFWLPEPPVSALTCAEPVRNGCVLYGTLAPRKGVELLASALSLAPSTTEVTLAGEVEGGFGPSLERYAETLRESGAVVEIRAWRHTEDEGLLLLREARCVVLPYLRHYTASRVLLEAATVGTPAVAHHHGLLGYLVRQHGLGLAVDCADPGALRAAVLSLTDGPDRTSAYAGSLERFAEAHSAERFARSLDGPFPTGVVAGSPARTPKVRA